VYHLRDADKMLVEKWFHTAVDLVQRAWRLYDRPFDPSDRADTERAFATDGLDEAGCVSVADGSRWQGGRRPIRRGAGGAARRPAGGARVPPQGWQDADRRSARGNL